MKNVAFLAMKICFMNLSYLNSTSKKHNMQHAYQSRFSSRNNTVKVIDVLLKFNNKSMVNGNN